MAHGSYGLVVEGPYDEAFYRTLVARIAGGNPVVESLIGGGHGLLRNFPGLLRRLEHIVAGGPVEAALVIKDADGHSVEEVEAQLAQRVAQRNFAFAHGVSFCAVQREMETWLLADHDAINRVSVNRGRNDGVVRFPEILEGVADPKTQLRRVLSRAGLDYSIAVCTEIAAEMDLERVGNRCPSFQRFAQKLRR